MLALPRQLRARGVLGINARNTDYVQLYNSRHLYPLVDDKLQTKRLALDAGIAVPALYGTMVTPGETKHFAELVASHDEFVLKPAHGSGGDGILVFTGRSARRRGQYRLIDGSFMTEAEIRFHATNIISGRYSLGGNRDCAMLEYCVRADPVFEHVSYRGIPDIRVLVFRGYPAAAMVRLPTRASHGKANLHQGAVGVGIDLITGQTVHGVLSSAATDEHPDTGELIAGIQVPNWAKLLELAARCYELTGLGYLGVDIVLDRYHGPLILELNARPGLAIQIANRIGLAERLRRIEAKPASASVADRLTWVRAAFNES
ncbi:MAG: alpha-L-glutamate ligase-like protein [Chromatiales bacterium]|nr:MAG: alpha-L-glutamate ligase-like protein [Chromatiales bacterium]